MISIPIPLRPALPVFFLMAMGACEKDKTLNCDTPDSCIDMASEMVAKGSGDLEAARNTLRSLCDKGDSGHADACALLAQMATGALAQPLNPQKADALNQKALVLRAKACESGDYLACGNVATQYRLGQFTEQSATLAHRYDSLALRFAKEQCDQSGLYGACAHMAIRLRNAKDADAHSAEIGEYMRRARDLAAKACKAGKTSACAFSALPGR